MSTFAYEIRSAILLLKQLHKKNAVSSRISTLFPIEDLQLKQKVIKKHDARTLFHTANAILNTLDDYLISTPITSQERGLDDFYLYFQNIIDQYYLDQHRVVHRTRFAAATLIDCIQMCNLPISKLTEELSLELKQRTKILCEIGNNSMLAQLLNTLQKNKKRHEFFFMIHLSHLRTCLKSFNRRIKPTSKSKVIKS